MASANSWKLIADFFDSSYSGSCWLVTTIDFVNNIWLIAIDFNWMANLFYFGVVQLDDTCVDFLEFFVAVPVCISIILGTKSGDQIFSNMWVFFHGFYVSLVPHIKRSEIRLDISIWMSCAGISLNILVDWSASMSLAILIIFQIDILLFLVNTFILFLVNLFYLIIFFGEIWSILVKFISTWWWCDLLVFIAFFSDSFRSCLNYFYSQTKNYIDFCQNFFWRFCTFLRTCLCRWKD